MPTDSSNDNKPFRHYSLKHHIIAWISTHFFDRITYTVRHGMLRGMKRKGGLGWMPASFTGGLETAEHRFWNGLDLKGKTVYDVGAFQGLLTLFFASKASQVICYEPNKNNRKRLEENLALNQVKNARVRPVGAGAARETLQMAYNPLMPGGASVEQTISGELKQSSGVVVEQIPITTLDIDIAEEKLSKPDFIKIDIEGWEIEALRGARATLLEHRPALFLEMHGETMNEKRRKVAEIVAFLLEVGYSNILHVETGERITAGNSALAARGHLFCSPH